MSISLSFPQPKVCRHWRLNSTCRCDASWMTDSYSFPLSHQHSWKWEVELLNSWRSVEGSNFWAWVAFSPINPILNVHGHSVIALVLLAYVIYIFFIFKTTAIWDSGYPGVSAWSIQFEFFHLDQFSSLLGLFTHYADQQNTSVWSQIRLRSYFASSFNTWIEFNPWMNCHDCGINCLRVMSVQMYNTPIIMCILCHNVERICCYWFRQLPKWFSQFLVQGFLVSTEVLALWDICTGSKPLDYSSFLCFPVLFSYILDTVWHVWFHMHKPRNAIN